MQVKGVAFLARVSYEVGLHGQAAWDAFYADFQKTEPVFQQQILPVSKLPTEPFVRLNEAIVKRFHARDPRPYWSFGMSSAEWAMEQGQLRGLFQRGELSRFLRFTPNIYKSYFDGGELRVADEAPQRMVLDIVGTPRHAYFEEAIIAFGEQGMRKLGAAHPVPERLKGFGAGDDTVSYRFRLD